MTFNIGDIIKWDATKVKTIERTIYGYITKIEDYPCIYVRWFHLDYDQSFTFSTANRVFKVIS